MALKGLCFYAALVVLVVCEISQAATIVVETTATVETVATADTFVRQNAPNENYGTKGGLSVAGSEARNGSGQLVGLGDTFLRFDLASAIESLDGEFGSHNWAVGDLGLKVVEQTTPDNPRFGRGQGQFEVRWIAADNWSEIALTWNTKDNYLNSGTDISVGTFTNLYQGDGYSPTQRFSLSLAEALVNDIRAGGNASFYLTATDPSIGFTFNSKDITGTRPKPHLEIVAILYNKADLNHDGFVNFLDCAKLAANWQKTGPVLDGDINEDRIVDYKDLKTLAENWLAYYP